MIKNCGHFITGYCQHCKQRPAFERISYEVEESFGVVTLCVALNMMSLDEE